MYVMILRDEFNVRNSNNEDVKIYGNGRCELVSRDKLGNTKICYGENAGKSIKYEQVVSLKNNIMDIEKLLNYTGKDNFMEALEEMNSLQKEIFFEIKDQRKSEIEDKVILEQIEEIKKGLGIFPIQKDGIPKIEDLYKKLTSNIRCQDEQIKVILSAIYNNLCLSHMNFSDDEKAKLKQNILICGSTGTGKTAVIRQIAHLINSPIVIEDSTQYTEAGYEGGDINSIFAHLIKKTASIEEAENGIVVFDEIDKLANNCPSSSDVSKMGVQESLLTLAEGGIIHVNIGSKFDPKEIPFDTSKITIIGLGAFEGIEKIRDSRCKLTKTLGFQANQNTEIQEKKSDKYIVEDFINYGIMSQLLGRFGQIVQMNTLDKNALKEILLNSDSSILLLKKKFYQMQGIELKYNDEFIEAICKKAIEYGCGARSLNAILNQIFSEGQFNLFTNKYKSFELNTETVEDPKKYILK